MEADLVVLDLRSTPIIDYRMKYAASLDEALFIQITLGDDRVIRSTYMAGERYTPPAMEPDQPMRKANA